MTLAEDSDVIIVADVTYGRGVNFTTLSSAKGDKHGVFADQTMKRRTQYWLHD